MNRNEFERLYVHNNHFGLTRSQTEVANRMRTDWDSFDRLCNSSDLAKTISIENAIEDVSQFFFLLKYAYSGYEYYSVRYDFEQLKSKLVNQLSSKFDASILCLNLCKILHQTLSPILMDGHVAVLYADFEGAFLQPYNPYVTDVIVEKESDHYIVIESNNLQMNKTTLQSSDIHGDLFPTLVPGCQNECYLIGRYTLKDPGYIEISGYRCKTHLLRCCHSDSHSSNLYQLNEESTHAIFTNTSYQFYEEIEKHERNFLHIGALCARKDFTIWDLSNNHGGNSRYPEAFLRGLNGYVQCEMDTAILHSPVVGNSDTDKYYEFQKAPVLDHTRSTYDGTLYIVMNKQTGSSAENAISFSQSCKNTITIGSPSAGVGLFGEVRPYRLINSGIFVLLPYKLFYENDFEIGKGKFPDYWIDNENPAEYILKCLEQ